MDALEVDHHYGRLELVAVETAKTYPQPGLPAFGYGHAATQPVFNHVPTAYDLAEKKFSESYAAAHEGQVPSEKQLAIFAQTYALNQMLKKDPQA